MEETVKNTEDLILEWNLPVSNGRFGSKTETYVANLSKKEISKILDKKTDVISWDKNYIEINIRVNLEIEKLEQSVSRMKNTILECMRFNSLHGIEKLQEQLFKNETKLKNLKKYAAENPSNV